MTLITVAVNIYATLPGPHGEKIKYNKCNKYTKLIYARHYHKFIWRSHTSVTLIDNLQTRFCYSYSQYITY